jgi:hypothetical protein
VETCFQAGNGLGLDEHQVRPGTPGYRHTTLVMLTHAILTAIVAHERAQHRDESLVSLSVNEIRRLLAKPVINAVHTADRGDRVQRNPVAADPRPQTVAAMVEGTPP